jgi:cobalt-zinc-cadmium efflux system outer membrane protein
MLRIVILSAISFLLAVLAVSKTPSAATLDLAEARRLVLRQNPRLQGLAADLAASEQASLQASAFDNPEIELATENFTRKETEIVITQRIPLGGTRGARIERARRETEIARLRLESERIALEAELIRRFASVLSAHRRIALTDSLIEAADGGIAAVERLVDAGATMKIDLVRSQLDREELLLERLDLERDLSQKQRSLAGLWGDMEFRFDGVAGSPVGVLEIPTFDALAAAMARQPVSMLADAESALVQAGFDQARAERWPELALSAGYLDNREADEGAPLAAISLSLPIFDRKGASIAAGERQVEAAGHRAALDRLKRSSTLAKLYSDIEINRKRLAALSEGLLPKAAGIHADLQNFYASGRVGILDVMEARWHLLGLRMRVLDLIEEQAHLGADLVELTGYGIEIIR